MGAFSVEPYLVKQLARQQIAGSLEESRSPEQCGSTKKIFIDRRRIVINDSGEDIACDRCHYPAETAYERRHSTGCEGDLPFQLTRQPLIIIVKKRDPFTFRLISADIARTARGHTGWIGE